MTREIIGIGLTLLIAVAGGIFYIGGLNERVNALESKSISEEKEKEKAIDEIQKIMTDFKNIDRTPGPDPLPVKGGGPWGRWHEATYCPKNHYVCGLEQKVEDKQGKGDDTTLNQVALRCCKLF